jgi:hypothetical protein
MKYAQMIDLIDQAAQAGESEFDADALLERFHVWLRGESLGEITDEEHDALFDAFWKGFAKASAC